MAGELVGLRKAAILLIQMGKDQAARVLSQLKESEVEEITAEIVRLGAVEAEVADEVLAEFHDMATAHKYVGQGGLELARTCSRRRSARTGPARSSAG